MSLFKHPEGPPTTADLQLLVMDLMYTDHVAEAHELAAVIVDHIVEMPVQQRPDHRTVEGYDFDRSFGYWLGIKSTTAHLLAGRRNRASRRADKRRHATCR